MMPKTSVSPAAMRNSITPSWSPLSVCSRTRTRFIGRPTKKGRGVVRAPELRCDAGGRSPHPAFLGVGILVVGEHRLLDLHHRVLPRRAGDRLQKVEILDREVVAVVAEFPARGSEIS